MNIFTDKIDSLKQDKWSTLTPAFGQNGHLTVIGYFDGLRNLKGGKSPQKYYVVKCEICTNDAEMYSEGLFYTTKHHLVEGKVPCGCSQVPKWNVDQWVIRSRRVAEHLGYKFNHIVGEWKGQRTKISLSCHIHGEWSTANIGDLVVKSNGCPACRLENLKKPDEEMIASFFNSGAFHPDTKFWRGNEIGPSGWKEFWLMDCPTCNQLCRTRATPLQRGFLPCGCGGVNKQKECYINLILNQNSVIAVKFGIANSSNRRLKVQNRTSRYDIQQHVVYKFPSVSACKSAEKECKDTLSCYLLTKEDMPDGWTETTSIFNINKITDIYERHGGILDV